MKTTNRIRKSLSKLNSAFRGIPRSRRRNKAPMAEIPAQVEHLEDRQLLTAVVSTVSFSGEYNLHINTYGNDMHRVDVYDANPSYIVVLTQTIDVYNGQLKQSTGQAFPKAGLDKVVFNGGNGVDILTATTTSDVIAYGGGGSDHLTGGSGNDVLYGQSGNDKLYGRDGNDVIKGGSGRDSIYGGNHDDKLYGQGDADYIYGGAGNDYLDRGFGALGSAYGGTGMDFDSHRWTSGSLGAHYTDINQGNAPTCWLNAAISAVAYSGVDLGQRISYAGDGLFRVGIYDSAGNYTTEFVRFDGDDVNGNPIDGTQNSSADPDPVGEEFWVILMHRAYLQSRGISLSNPPGGWPDDAMTAFTGKASTTYTPGTAGYGNMDLSRIWGALKYNNAPVTAGTWGRGTALGSSQLVNWHAYVVMDLFYANGQWNVELRNPWGTDGGVADATPDREANNDGRIVVSWTAFTQSMSGYSINRGTVSGGSAGSTGRYVGDAVDSVADVKSSSQADLLFAKAAAALDAVVTPGADTADGSTDRSRVDGKQKQPQVSLRNRVENRLSVIPAMMTADIDGMFSEFDQDPVDDLMTKPSAKLDPPFESLGFNNESTVV